MVNFMEILTDQKKNHDNLYIRILYYHFQKEFDIAVSLQSKVNHHVLTN